MTEKDIHKICKVYKIVNYSINSDMSIDVDQNVNISNCNLTNLPLNFGFGKGFFTCSDNKLTTLKGAPHTVCGSFYCNHNQLTTLEYSPTHVLSDYMCNSNLLTTMNGAPSKIFGSFYCGVNKFNSLDSLPESIHGHISFGIGITAPDYFSTLMWIMDCDKYVYYDTLDKIFQILPPILKDEFVSWLSAKRRIDTIAEIIIYDDNIRH